MSTNWRLRCAALGGAAAFALSAFLAAPAQADDAPPAGLVEAQMPEGTTITEGTAPAAGSTLPDSRAATLAAAADHPCLGTTAVYGATGCFQVYGDVIWAKDTAKDGMSAAVGVYTDYGRAPEVCINSLGADTWATCNKDYKETGNVRLRVLRYDGDTGTFYQPEAWSGWIPVDGQ